MANAVSGREIGGREPQEVLPACCQYGLPGEAGPVLLSVPHCGREYPADILALSRGGQRTLQFLEDRYVDALAVDAIAAGHCVLVARRARAIIDLNRHPEEINADSVEGIPHGAPMRTSAKLRGGLGLVPHHYHGSGDLWRRRPTYAQVQGRIAAFHTPWHERIGALLGETAARHGAALLIDLHSMPSIRPRPGEKPIEAVIGDRFGQSTGDGVTRRAAEILSGLGVNVAINAPYAGGYTLERHARPMRGVHAIQLEIDRALYLDLALDRPGHGLTRWGGIVAALVEGMAAFLRDRGLDGETLPLAAE